MLAQAKACGHILSVPENPDHGLAVILYHFTLCPGIRVQVKPFYRINKELMKSTDRKRREILVKVVAVGLADPLQTHFS